MRLTFWSELTGFTQPFGASSTQMKENPVSHSSYYGARLSSRSLSSAAVR